MYTVLKILGSSKSCKCIIILCCILCRPISLFCAHPDQHQKTAFSSTHHNKQQINKIFYNNTGETITKTSPKEIEARQPPPLTANAFEDLFLSEMHQLGHLLCNDVCTELEHLYIMYII